MMIQSVERAVRILQCFEEQDQMGITQIAKKTRLTKSTAFGLASTLVETGLLEQDAATSQYRLGLELFRLGSRVDIDGRRQIVAELAALCETLDETVNYMRPEGTDIVYLVKKETSHSMRICTTIGQRLPMYCTAGGKAIMAYLPEEERERILQRFRFTAYTGNTVTTAEALRRELAEARASGCAFDREELELGLTCIAVPMRNGSGYPVAAISCSGPTTRMTEEKLRQCQAALSACAERLGASI